MVLKVVLKKSKVIGQLVLVKIFVKYPLLFVSWFGKNTANGKEPANI